MLKTKSKFLVSVCRLKVLFLSILLSVAFAEPLKAQDNILKRLGFRLTQIKSKDFILPYIEGSKGSLSDYRGKWVLLNFWATWCGPCRQEMPTLESVAQEFQNSHIQVVGVSVDQGKRGLVKKYLKETGITFPNFHDYQSEVSRIYQATAIPSVYMISPDGFLAGVFRGGKSWETQEVFNELKKLAQYKTLADLNGGKDFGGNKENFSFPKDLLPPVMKVSPLKIEDSIFKTGGVHTLKLAVTWPGDSRRYLIKVPKVKFPKGIKSMGVRSTTGLRDGQSVLEYHYPFEIREKGNFQIGPIELSYSPRSGGPERFSRHPGISLNVIDQWGRLGWKELGFVVCLLSISVLILFLKREKKGKKVFSSGEECSSWINEALFEELQRMKMEGKQKEYVLKLIELNRRLSLQKGLDGKEEKDLLEAHKYGGGKAVDEMKVRFLEKRLEQEVKKEEFV
ncbi:MAG: hypothetical protein CME68_00640 [Halobacteriovoraceae bacterium]|nr:hypothetical protein [Halobacteriovoraceae bacterium]